MDSNNTNNTNNTKNTGSLCVKLIHCGNRNITNPADHREKNIFQMPMGLFSMAGLLKENGMHVEIINLDLESGTDIRAVLDFNTLDAVGLDCHWVNQGLAVINLAEAIKRIKPGVFIFLGGYTASFFAAEILESYSFIDAIVRGDGEVPILELCTALRRRPGNSLEHVQNLAWRAGNNKIVFNPVSYVADSGEMNRFDFAGMDLLRNRELHLEFSRYWTGFSPLNRRPLFLLEIGRGCRYNCVYCGGNARAQECISNRQDLAIRSVDAVTDTIKEAVFFGYKLFLASFEFAGSDHWYIDLFKRIKEEKLGIDFAYESWGIPSKALIDELSRCFDRAIITISPDSADNRLREKNMDNRLFYSNSRLEECLDYIGARNNLNVQLYFGYFLPFDTEETVFSTMDYLSKLFFKYSYFAEIIYMNFNTDPCSSLFLEPGKYDMEISVRSFKDFLRKTAENYITGNGKKPGLTLLSRPAGMTEAQAVNLANKANLFNHLFCLKDSILQLFEKTGRTNILSGYLREIDLFDARESDFTVERFKEVLLEIAGKYIPADTEIIDLINGEYDEMPLKFHIDASTNFYIPGSKRKSAGIMEQNLLITIEEFEEAEKYWLDKLSGELHEVKLTGDFPGTRKYKEGHYKIVFTPGLSERLAGISKNNDLSLYVILLTAFKILLFKYTGQKDILAASPVYTEGSWEYNRYVVFRDFVDPAATFRELLMTVKQTVVEGYKNDYYPLENLFHSLDIEEGAMLSRAALFLETIHQKELIDGMINPGHNHIALCARGNGKELAGDIIFNSELFRKDTIGRFGNFYLHVLARVLENVDVRVSDIELNTEEEKEEILFGFNNTGRDYPGDKTLHELFENQAERIPDHAAVRTAVDLSDVTRELKTGKIERWCFSKNPFVYRYDFRSAHEKDGFTILKTHCHNSVIVNDNALKLTGCFDGKRDVEAVFPLLKDRRIPLFLLPVGSGDVLEVTARYDKAVRIILAGNFTDFREVLRLLYENHLIELKGIRSFEANPAAAPPSRDFFDESPGNEVFSVDTAGPGKELSPADVLLLGDTPGTPTVGLLYLASYLRRNGIKACCRFNDAAYDYASLKKSTLDLLEKIQPRIVGVSMKWFPYMARVVDICKIVKDYSPGIQVVVGGNSASYYREKLWGFDCIDYIIRGDGEAPLLELCRGTAPGDIPNLLYKKDGKIMETPMSYVQDETDSPGIYLSHLDEILVSSWDSLFGSFFIYTHKGCPMNCIYCGGCREAQVKTFGRKKFFKRGPAEVRRDLQEAMKYTSTFLFDFTSDNDKLLEYCREIWEGIDLSAHFCVYTNVYTPSPQLVEYVNRTFKYVYWDFDLASLSQGHRKQLFSTGLVKPQPTDKEMLEFFGQCEKYGSNEVRINLINGLPYFGSEDIERSRKMLSHIMSSYSCFSRLHWARLHAQPAAPIVENPGKYGMYSQASTFEDFFAASLKNFNRESGYPTFENYKYPYIYFADDRLNSELSRYYLDSNLAVEQNNENRWKQLHVHEELTYRELSKKAGRLAGQLREKGVGPGSIVGLMMHGSLEMAVGILGILKAGAAYLPIDPDYPRERIDYMLNDSNANVLVSEVSELSKEPAHPAHLSHPAHPCCVIYTSGTTGIPKGVIVEHRGIVNYTCWRLNTYGYTENDVTLQLLPHIFDGFASNFYSSLLSGGVLIMIPGSRRLDFDYIKKVIKHNRVTNASLVPGMYEALLDSAGDGDLDSLRFVVLAGEETRVNLIKKIKKKQPGLLLIDEYGPTEVSVTAAAHLLVDEKSTAVIGKPIANTRIYILDTLLKLCPVGIPGELYVAGDGVARGYLNNPELTVEKFLGLTAKTREGTRISSFIIHHSSFRSLYRTGDLARWRPDGSIRYLGRKDSQVKIRGTRVELGEIENRLLEHSDIKDVVVLANEENNGEKSLCAYMVSDTVLVESELREYLSRQLPDYMIPLYFIQVEKIPLTPGGKVNRKGLPSPGAGGGREEYTAPRDDVEEKLVGIWSEVLGKGKSIIGIDANFFELGGHSLKAASLVSMVHKEFNVKVSLEEIFKKSTVRGIADCIKRSAADRFIFIEPAEKMEYYALSPAQKRLFILQELNPGSTGYNMFNTVELEGEFETGKLEEIFMEMIRRHENLRTSFEIVDGVPVQKIHHHRDMEFKIAYYEESLSAEVEKIVDGFRRPFDLSRAPLLRVGLIKTGETRGILMLDMHHIVSDGVSMVIFVKEFGILYSGKELPPLRLQYKDFSEWQNKGMGSKALKRQEEYWLERFKEEVPALSLPVDYERPSVQGFVGDRISFSLGKEVTALINELAARHDVTQFMAILALYNVLLSKLGDQEDIVVGTSTAGRNHADLDRIMGVFFNTLALRNYPQKDKIFVDFLNEVKKNALGAFENQDYQFDDLVEKVAPDRDAGRNPIYNVKLVLLNVDTRDLEIPGLRLKLVDFENRTTKLDLGLSGAEVEGELLFTFEYSTGLFRRETIEEFIAYFKHIISSVLDDPGQRLYEIGKIAGVKREEILSQFSEELENE